MEQEIIELSKKLISVASVKENPQAMIDVLAIARNVLPGFAVQEFESHGSPSLLFYNTPTLPERFRLILNAHLDVVPAKSEQFVPFVKDGRLYGRGASDMKTGAASEILVFQQLAKQVSFPIGLQLVTDEETGGFHGTKYQIQEGIRADFVISGEQTDLKVNNLAKGILVAKVTLHGSSAHAAYLWDGANAIQQMQQFLNDLYFHFPIPDKEVWRTTANVSVIETSNMAFNKVPDNCSVIIDIRYIPEDTDTIEQQLRVLLPKNATVEIFEKEPAQRTNNDHPDLIALQTTIESLTGSVDVIAKHGASDIRHYDGVDCSGVCFGPVGVGLHTDNEYGEISSFNTYFRILEKFILSLS